MVLHVVRRKIGKGGRCAAGKTIIGIAVEDKKGDGIGRVRSAKPPDASVGSLDTFGTRTAACEIHIH